MEPRKDTSQRGIDCKKPTLSMASTISLGRVAACVTAPPIPTHNGLHDAAADGEDSGHDLHTVAHGHLGGGKADKVPQGIFGPLDLPKRGGGLEHAHCEKQHQ